MQRWFVPHTYFQLAFQLAIAGVVYGTGLLWALKSNRLWSVRELPARNKSEMVLPITKAYQSGEVAER